MAEHEHNGQRARDAVDIEVHFAGNLSHDGGSGGIKNQADPEKGCVPDFQAAGYFFTPHADGVKSQGGKHTTDSSDKYIDPSASPKVPKVSRRAAFAEAATANNPLLARAFVNRMWAALIGRGIVHPADEMNARNVPSHPQLLDWMAQDFIGHGYDVRDFIRGVVLSRPYGLSPGISIPEAFAAANERPLTGEQLARSWRVAAGLTPEDDALRHAVVSALPEVLPKDYNVSFQQAQFLSGSSALSGLLQDGTGTTVARLTSLTESEARVREAFSAVYGRSPEANELTQASGFLDHMDGAPLDKTRDLLWALMTSAEFLTLP